MTITHDPLATWVWQNPELLAQHIYFNVSLCRTFQQNHIMNRTVVCCFSTTLELPLGHTVTFRSVPLQGSYRHGLKRISFLLQCFKSCTCNTLVLSESSTPLEQVHLHILIEPVPFNLKEFPLGKHPSVFMLAHEYTRIVYRISQCRCRLNFWECKLFVNVILVVDFFCVGSSVQGWYFLWQVQIELLRWTLLVYVCHEVKWRLPGRCGLELRCWLVAGCCTSWAE